MTAVLSDGDAQRENERDERDAQGWETVGGDGEVPSQAEIRWKCAFTYMNAVSRKNLTDGCAVDANGRRHCTRQRLRTQRSQRQSAVRPDEREMHLGRERPPAGRAWGEEGGSQMGVAHALLAALLGCDSGADSRPAAQSAAGLRSPNSQTAKNMEVAHLRPRAIAHVSVQREQLSPPGNGAPEFRFPHPVPLLSSP